MTAPVLTADELAYHTDIHSRNFPLPNITTNIVSDDDDMAKSHKRYADANSKRLKTLKALSGLLPETDPDLSDIDGDIPVYTYTEPFIETESVIN